MPRKIDHETNRSQKCLNLFIFLMSSRQAWSLTDLARRQKCAKQTVLNLISDIEKSGWGVVVREMRGNRRYFSLARPQNTLEMPLSSDRLSNLFLCRDFLSVLLPPVVRADVNDSLLLLRNYLPPNQLPPVPIGQSIFKGQIDYAPFEYFWRTLVSSIEREKACRILYQAAINQPTKSFLFAPKKMLAYHESLYVGGWKVQKERLLKPVGERTLALQRIRDVEMLTYTTINIGAPKGFVGDAFGIMLHDPFRATIKFAPDAATYVYERQWSKDQTIVKHNDGSLTLRMTCRNSQEAISWVLGFGPSARVLRPGWLAEMVLNKLLSATSLYRRGAPHRGEHN